MEFPIRPDLDKTSIVLLGSFNPLIFQPQWFAGKEIIGEDEASWAAEHKKIRAIHPDVTAFNLRWLNFEVTQNRLKAETAEKPFIRIFDFVVRTFQPTFPIWPLGWLKFNPIGLRWGAR